MFLEFMDKFQHFMQSILNGLYYILKTVNFKHTNNYKYFKETNIFSN